jgi:hypothetical protein
MLARFREAVKSGIMGFEKKGERAARTDLKILNGEALKAIIKHYILFDRQYRRVFLIYVGHFVLAVLVLTVLSIFGKVPALFLFTVSAGLSFGVGLGMPVAMGGGIIRREKAEGSFRVLCALPLRAETLFLGTMLAGVISSILAFLPLLAIATIGLILQGRGDIARLQIYVGWGVLLMSFFSASVSLTVALCVNSPAAIANVVGGGVSLIIILQFIIRHIFGIQIISEEEALRFIDFILSPEGVTLVSAIVMGLSLLISYVGSRIFLRKGSYV